jgi:hypothetical protein
MKQETISTRARSATPRAAAVAGILFAVLLITGLLLFRLAVRADPLETRDGVRKLRWRSGLVVPIKMRLQVGRQKLSR